MVGQSVEISLATNEVEVQINYNQFADINVAATTRVGKQSVMYGSYYFACPKIIT